MWGKVSCLRKQHDDGDWASNHQPLDLKVQALTTTPPSPHYNTNNNNNDNNDNDKIKVKSLQHKFHSDTYNACYNRNFKLQTWSLHYWHE